MYSKEFQSISWLLHCSHSSLTYHIVFHRILFICSTFLSTGSSPRLQRGPARAWLTAAFGPRPGARAQECRKYEKSTLKHIEIRQFLILMYFYIFKHMSIPPLPPSQPPQPHPNRQSNPCLFISSPKLSMSFHGCLRIRRCASWEQIENLAFPANLTITTRTASKVCARSRSQSPSVSSLDLDS